MVYSIFYSCLCFLLRIWFKPGSHLRGAIAKKCPHNLKVAPTSHIEHITFFFVPIFWNLMCTSPQEISPVFHFKGDIWTPFFFKMDVIMCIKMFFLYNFVCPMFTFTLCSEKRIFFIYKWITCICAKICTLLMCCIYIMTWSLIFFCNIITVCFFFVHKHCFLYVDVYFIKIVKTRYKPWK